MGFPMSFLPPNGVFLDLDFNEGGSTIHSAAGSKIVKFAASPSAMTIEGRWRMRRGLTESFSINCASVRTPDWTSSVTLMPIAVSSPTIPKGANWNSTSFSS